MEIKTLEKQKVTVVPSGKLLLERRRLEVLKYMNSKRTLWARIKDNFREDKYSLHHLKAIYLDTYGKGVRKYPPFYKQVQKLK